MKFSIVVLILLSFLSSIGFCKDENKTRPRKTTKQYSRPPCGLRNLGVPDSHPMWRRSVGNKTMTFPDSNDAEFFVPMFVGGDVVQITRIPWQVSLWYLEEFKCGGSILNNRYILSAAHCFSAVSTSPRDWTVYASKTLKDVGEPGEIGPIKVQSINMHPSYKRGSYDHDAVLLRLSTSLTYSKTVQPICVPKEGTDLFPGSKCYSGGYGDTKGSGGEGKLKEGKVPLYKPSQCNSMFRLQVTNAMLCAGYPEGGIDACQGDSGGALYCEIKPGIDQYVQQGIISFGRGCAQENMPGVYTRTVMYMPWIKRVVASRL